MDTFDLIGNVMIPLLALVISISLYRRSVSQTVVEFFTQGNTVEQKDCRKKLYDAFEKTKKPLSAEKLFKLDEDGSMAKIVSFYDTWATVQKQHLLPLKTFKGIAGVTAVKVYCLLRPYIEERRKRITVLKDMEISNSEYARNFEDMIFNIIEKNYVVTNGDILFATCNRKQNFFCCIIGRAKKMIPKPKAQKKYRLVGQQYYQDAQGDKYNRIVETKKKIDKYYAGVDNQDELIHCYKRTLVVKFLNDNVFFAMQIGFLSFALGFLVEKFFEHYNELVESLTLNMQNSLVSSIISVLVLTIALIVTILIFILTTTKSLVKDYKSDYQVFILPYEKKVIEAKLKEKTEIEDILNAMKD